MSMSDPLADMLTRIRNGLMAKFDTIEMPSSKTKANFLISILLKSLKTKDISIHFQSRKRDLRVS